VFACAPTGSGKTLAFIVPILAHLKVLTISMCCYIPYLVMNTSYGCIHILLKECSSTPHKHTRAHTHTHICTHSNMHTHMYTHTCTHNYATYNIHTLLLHTCTHTIITYTHACAHIHTCVHTHVHTHAHIYTCTDNAQMQWRL